MSYEAFLPPPPPNHSLPKNRKGPKELDEINQLQGNEPITHEQGALLSHDVFDSITEWQEKGLEDQEFVKSVQTDLGQLAVTAYESPAEKDPSFGQVHSSIKAIWASPSAFDSDRNPPRPKFED